MRRRRLPLIIVSIALHVVVVLVLWISSVWEIEPLERGPDRLANLAVLDMHAPAAAGNPAPQPKPEFAPKPPTHVTHDIVQPTRKPEEPPAPTTGIIGTGKPGDTTDTDVTGHCDTPPCAPVEEKQPERKPDPPPPPAPKKPLIVKPSDLAQIRIAGETQVHPSEVDKMSIIRAGDRGTWGQFLICVDERGAVSSVQLRHSTGYSDYDARLAAAIHGWRYRPYLVAGEPQPICSTVRFDYSM